MKDIFLLTDRPIVWGDCKTAILSVFPNAKGDNSMLLIRAITENFANMV